MGWKKILGDAKEKIDDYAEKRRMENEEKERIERMEYEQRKSEREAHESAYRKYEKEVNDLLSKFDISELESLLLKILNVKVGDIFVPQGESGGYRRRPERIDFTRKIWGHLREGSLHKEQIKDFALKYKIVAPSFFGAEHDNEFEDDNEFENIINAIKVNFQPEKIKDEKELEAQLTIFIKAKFPGIKLERQVISKNGDVLDLVINDKYVFELKVPKQRNTLRDLSAQLEEYSESYPNLCAVIADISEEINIVDDAGNSVIEDAKLTEHIRDYADRYRRKYNIDTIVLNTGMRK